MTDTFRAIRLEKTDAGQEARFVDLTLADLMDGDVTVRVEYSTVNYKDGLALTGKAPVVRTWPLTPGIDFVSRFFAPQSGIPEDPVTGSAHCVLAVYWADRLGKSTFIANQLSPRGGELGVELMGDRVELRGHGTTTMAGKLLI